MIVVDIETSGINPEEHGIWQIGAIELENPENTFLEESNIDSEDKIHPEALKIIGKSEQELRSSSLQSQKKLLEKFFSWIEKIENQTLIAHNTPFDYGFLTFKARKYNLKPTFGHRTFDLHSIAAVKYYQINRKFLTDKDKSAMNLPKIIEFCGMKDERIQISEGKVVQEGSSHNAIKDTKLEAECFSRIVFGKNLLKDFEKFSIPNYLKEN